MCFGSINMHQARSEEIEPGASREISLQERDNFATVAKFRYIANFLYSSKFSLCRETPFSLFLCTNDPVFG